MMMIDRDTLAKKLAITEHLEMFGEMFGDVWSIGKPCESHASESVSPSHCLRGCLTSPHAGLYLGRPFSASSPSSTL